MEAGVRLERDVARAIVIFLFPPAWVALFALPLALC